MTRDVRLALGVTAMVTVALGLPIGETVADPMAKGIVRNKGCGACHIIPGIPEAMGTLGPSLKGFKDRPRIAAGRLENTPEGLRDWLKDPKRIYADTMMPNLGLNDAEIKILIEFLYTL